MAYTGAIMNADETAADKQLWNAYSSTGSPEALARIIERYSNLVYSTCYRIVGDSTAAEDASQATYLLFVKKAKSLPGNTILATWLYYAARNCALTIVREENRRVKREHQAAEMVNSINVDNGWNDMRADLDDALESLPSAQREAIVARYFCGLGEREAALTLNCPERTLHTRIFRGMTRLRERFARRGMLITDGALVGFLSHGVIQAAPSGLAARIVSVCAGKMSASTVALSTSDAIAKTMLTAQIKSTVLIACVVLTLCATAYLKFQPQQKSATQLNNGIAPGIPAVSPTLPDAAPIVSASYSAWKNGPSKDPAYFPIGVWAQRAECASEYKNVGINLYVHLFGGPTEEELTILKQVGMQVICQQNEVALQHLDDPTIVGWKIAHQPDQDDGPSVAPDKLIEQYHDIVRADSTRPIFLPLGQGVARDHFAGRGERREHPEDYTEFLKGCDIASFNIYPVVHPEPEISGKLWYVARGVERLRKWSADRKIVWNFIECTRIDSETKATPEQVKTEVWMSLIHGSRGIIYFAHQFNPAFNDRALLDDPAIVGAVAAINKQVLTLAPVLNSPTIEDGATVTAANPATSVACMVKHLDGATYLFAVNMREIKTSAAFNVRKLNAKAQAEVLQESRSLAVESGRFTDSFGPYAVHLYRIR
jgi:RNA polymerase sigma factor (sigma-70 family)